MWKEEPNPYMKAAMDFGKGISLANSVGITIDKDGKVTGTRWDSPAFNAGIVTGTQIMAVNGMAYSADDMKKAVTAAKGEGGKPIELLTKRGSRFETVKLDYKDGLRYPWLERVAPGKAPVGLDLLLTPKRSGAGVAAKTK